MASTKGFFSSCNKVTGQPLPRPALANLKKIIKKLDIDTLKQELTEADFDLLSLTFANINIHTEGQSTQRHFFLSHKYT